MSNPTAPAGGSRLPARPSLEQLRKQAKERLTTLRAADPAAKLADAQFALAREYGFESWPKLVHFVSSAHAQSAAPRITAPVSRWLGARDVARTAAFWRDVLGFEQLAPDDERGDAGAEVVLVSGQARIRLGARDWAPDFSDEGREPGSAVIFFQTDELDAMRAAVHARGGAPGEIAKVNGIKMRVFQLSDPDAHAIWFGQSYQVDFPERAPAMMRTVMPELPVDDVPASVRHYRDVLGFSVNYEQHDIGVMDRDDTRLLLIARTRRHTGIGSAYFYVRSADALYAELLERGADVQGEPTSQPWGLREFSVADPDGNRLTFGQTFE